MKADYKNGRKNQWRRTLWNVIAKKLQVPARDAICVYLAGPEDLDRPVAKSKGLKDHNLIAVEREPLFLKRIRNAGTLCVDGDLFEALFAIAEKRKVHAIYGDFVCGLEKSVLQNITDAVQHPNLKQSVFAFNFLRGRDASTNGIRAICDKYLTGETREALKHRGKLLNLSLMLSTAEDSRQFYGISGPLSKEQLLSMAAWWDTAAEAHTLSYKSGVQTFDSIVFRNPIQFGVEHGNTAKISHFEAFISRQTKASATAILAHRTMRITA